MEAHHIIPLHLQENFQYSLDVYANIICLCPLCHRQIHYGVYKERREMLDAIFEQRKERLNNSGILMDKGEFMQMILSE
jgi:5-methylcytosine-specific restriction protein A